MFIPINLCKSVFLHLFMESALHSVILCELEASITAAFLQCHCCSGLPDGFFSNQKSQFGEILEGPRLENFVAFYGHLEYFTDIWVIL
jgi:hypothetical protein